MREFMNLTRALADETRVRMLLALRGGELCVCQITALFGLAPSTVSKHLFLLKQAGLVDSRKEGRWIHYSLPPADAPHAVRHGLAFVEKCLAGDARVEADARHLARVLKLDPAVLCRRQCRK